MQQRLYIYQTKVHDADELKKCMLCLACSLEQIVISDAINEWHKHLRACIEDILSS